MANKADKISIEIEIKEHVPQQNEFKLEVSTIEVTVGSLKIPVSPGNVSVDDLNSKAKPIYANMTFDVYLHAGTT